MKNYLRLYLSDGLGSVAYNGPSPTAPGNPTLIGANDGLSTDAATGKIAQLGQTVGRAGDLAVLLEAREIPDGQPGNHFPISLGRNNGVDDIILMGTDIGYNISNKSGAMFEGIGTIAGSQARIKLITDDGINARIEFSSTTIVSGPVDIDYNDDAANTGRFDVNAPWMMDTGYGTNNFPITSAAHPAYAILKTDSIFLIDTTAGNIRFDIGVVAGGYANQIFRFKKISADVNTVTLNMTAGTIQGIGAPAATFVFNLQGESITVYVDSLNAYVI